MIREATHKVIQMAEDGVISWETVARECLSFMSEQDVAGMASANDWIGDDEDDDKE